MQVSVWWVVLALFAGAAFGFIVGGALGRGSAIDDRLDQYEEAPARSEDTESW